MPLVYDLIKQSTIINYYGFDNASNFIKVPMSEYETLHI